MMNAGIRLLSDVHFCAVMKEGDMAHDDSFHSLFPSVYSTITDRRILHVFQC